MTDEVQRPRRRVRRRTIALILLVELVLCVGIVTLVMRGHERDAGAVQREAGLPTDVSTRLADQMGLSPLSTIAERNFTLTDQLGQTVSLRALRGKAVVLQFMDPHCTDVCPIASAEVVDAYRDLGAQRADVEFVTVNVNRYADTPSAAKTFTAEHGLGAVPTWHFVSGPLAALRTVWHNYDVEVISKGPTADVIHSDQLYFISPSGKIRFIAMTTVDYTKDGVAYLPPASELAWGRGIANVAASLLS